MLTEQNEQQTGNGSQTMSSGSNTNGGVDYQVTNDCLAIVDQYKSGDVSRATALVRLQEALPEKMSEKQCEQSFDTYAEMLFEFDKRSKDAEGKNQEVARQIGQGDRNDEESDQARRVDQRDLNDEDSDQEDGTGNKEIQETTDRSIIRRKRSPTPFDEGERSKCRVDESKFYWLKPVQTIRLPEHLEKTRAALATFASEPKFVRSTIINSPGCPPFPDLEWLNLVSGKAINLDRVLSASYAISSDDKQVTTVMLYHW
jgi:hypothetical protein